MPFGRQLIGLSGLSLQSGLIDYERPLCGMLLAGRNSRYVPEPVVVRQYLDGVRTSLPKLIADLYDYKQIPLNYF